MNAFTHGLTGTLEMLVQRRHQLVEMFCKTNETSTRGMLS